MLRWVLDILDVLVKWLKDSLSLFGKRLFLIALIDAHFEVVAGAFDLVLELEQLFERMVEVHNLGSSLVSERFAYFFEALRSF